MKEISSRANPTVKKVVELRQSKYRTKERLFIGQGTRVCSTLLASQLKVGQLFVTAPLLSAAQRLVPDELITIVTDPVMEKMSTLATPPGILGVFEMPAPSEIELKRGIILYNVSDPGNMGTLIRSAAAMNVDTVITCEGADPWSPKVVQASAGTVGLVTIHSLPWDKLLQHKGDATFAALTVNGTKRPEQLKKDALFLVVGSEAHGIPKELLKDCDETITIPMTSNVESLNAAVAGSIALYLLLLR